MTYTPSARATEYADGFARRNLRGAFFAQCERLGEEAAMTQYERWMAIVARTSVRLAARDRHPQQHP